MWLTNFLKRPTATSSRRRPTRRPPSARLCLEALEDRCVLSYSIIDLGTLGGTYAHASDINDSGQVVGWSTLSNGYGRAFLWQNGSMTDLGTLGGDSSTALGINDIGQIVGYSSGGDSINHAFLLTPEDTDGDGAPDLWFRDIDNDGKNDLMLDLGPGIARDVNNAGQVVGYSGPPGASRASLWQNGVMTDLGTLGGATSYATAINDAGQVTGISYTSTGFTSAFVWQGSVMHDIGPATDVGDINQAGQIAVGSNAALWTPTTLNGTTGSFQTLGVLSPNLGYQSLWDYSSATGVNDLGTVVGISTTMYFYSDSEGGSSFEDWRGFVWADGIMQDLAEWGLQYATAVNNAGQIVGNGPYDYTAQLPYRAYLLTSESVATPFIHVDDVTITEGNSGTKTAVFTVRLSQASSQTVTVDFATANGSATAGSDYQPVSGSVSFAPGEFFQTISVLVYGDRIAEPNETFFVNLSGAVNATIADSQGVGTIIDDEPRISIGNVSQLEGNSGTTVFWFTVTLSAIYDQDVTVFFQTLDGTATSGSDYQATSGWLTFKAGETVAYIDVIVYGDTTQEADETFYVQLSGASSNAWLDDDLGIGWILNDDDAAKPGNKGGKKK